MTIGTATFNKSARFAFCRSYVDDFYISRNGDTFVQTGGRLVVTDALNPLLTATFQIDSRFFVWSSNGWTLDHIITESFYQNFPGDVQHPLPYNLNWDTSLQTGRTALWLGWSGFLIDPVRIDWPSQPANYWLPKPLP